MKISAKVSVSPFSELGDGFINGQQDFAVQKVFPPLPKFGNKRDNKQTKFDTAETLLAHIETFPPKSRSGNFRRI